MLNLFDDYKWVACSQEMSWSASQSRHLVAKGHHTTLCGHSASHAEVWRGNGKKPKCEACVKSAAALGYTEPEPKKGAPMEFTKDQSDYLLRIKKSATQLKISSNAVIEDLQEIQTCLSKDSEVWPGIPNATVFAAAARAAAEIDTLLGMRRHFFPRPSVDASSEEKAANMKLVSEAIGEALEGF